MAIINFSSSSTQAKLAFAGFKTLILLVRVGRLPCGKPQSVYVCMSANSIRQIIENGFIWENNDKYLSGVVLAEIRLFLHQK